MIRRGRLRKKEAAGISLFLAVIFSALLLTNLVLLAGAKNHFHILQAGTKLEQEAERALSLYDLYLFDHYGLWGMAEDLEKHLAGHSDVRASFSEIEGCRGYSYELSGMLWQPMALKKQIRQFMTIRFPAAMAEQLFSVLKSFKAASAASELTTMEAALQKPELQKGFSDLNTYLEELPEELEQPSAESEEEETESEEQEMDALTFLLMRALQAQMQEATAAAVEFGVETAGSAVTSRNVFSYLSQAQSFLDFDTGTTYDRLALNEYVLRMFPARVHGSDLDEDYPLTKSLRGKRLTREEAKEHLSLESLITGDRRAIAERKITSYLFMLRFLVQSVGILTNQGKMAECRGTATTVSLVVSAASLGHFNIPAEALLYAIVCIAALKNASEDVNDLSEGKSVPYIPQHESMKLPSYYHDYLRLFLLTLSEEELLNRLCQTLKKESGKDVYTSVSVRMDWKSPYFPEMEEIFKTRRQYALYKE